MGRRILHLRSGGPGFPGDIAAFCRATTPRWELTGDGALLDISGTDRMLGPGLDGVETLCRRAGGATAGAGPTILAARLASRLAGVLGGGAYDVREGSVGSFLALFPIVFLPARPGEIDRLRQLGVRTLGDLQVVPRALLKAVFGDRGRELADEAAGVAGRTLVPESGRGREESSGLALVAGLRLTRPLNDRGAESALLRGLAMRALAACPEGPAERSTWRLAAGHPGPGRDTAYASGRGGGGWSAWVAHLDLLWRRLPRRRTGIILVELHASPPRGASFRQESLFEEDRRDRRLALALARSRGAVGVAGEELLRAWGGRWFGPHGFG